MLNGIHIVDFGNHRDTELRFGAFTALVGQNGAGKTNVMRAIMALSAKFHGDESATLEFTKLKRVGTQKPRLATGWAGRFNSETGDWGFEMDNREASRCWRTRVSGAESSWIPEFLLGEPDTIPLKRVVHPLDRFLGIEETTLSPGEVFEIDQNDGRIPDWIAGYFKFSSDRLRGPSYTEVNPPALLENGAEFAWTLAYLMTAKPDCFREIKDALREVVPVVRNVRARPVRISQVERKTLTIEDQKSTFNEERTVMGQELIFDMVSGEGLPAAFVSDGTLIVLAVLTAIMHGDSEPSAAKTILLDDIEQGLHPNAQRTLIRQLRRLQEVRPGLQIIVTSHSPYVVDELSPEDVWLFAPDKEGCAAYARLSEHPDVDQALKVLTTGEFWSSEGEEWVLDPKKRANPRKKRRTA
jgi:predicted ATPase